MSYLVLARKYRPASFAAVSGQEHVTRTLSNAITRGKVAHAYLFAGPRGVGKTSIARIFAKSLNCQEGPTAEPCLKCTNCIEIAEGNSLAVREIDGASHNSVDNVRELIESFRSLPAPGSRYKVYIVDEVHMLSSSAFNALLKSLEEPPPHTVFILATTEAHKIPETVISRCQRFDLRALSTESIEECLCQIARKESMDVEPEVMRMIARLADGSMRDAQSLLDRVESFCDGKISASEASLVLGIVERNVLLQLSEAVFKHDTSRLLEIVHEAFSVGLNPSVFLKEFASHWRELLLAKFGGLPALSQIGVSKDAASLLQQQVQEVSKQDLQDLVQLAREGADAALRSNYPKYAIEALLVRMAVREEVKDLGLLLGQLKQILAAPSVLSARKRAPAKQAVHPPLQQEISKEAASRVVESKPVKAAMIDVSAMSEESAESAGSLDWGAFVEFVAQSGAPMLAEHLRRLSLTIFTGGRLEARGPEFSVSSLKTKENIKKLLNLLKDFSKIASWQVEFSNGLSVGEAEPDSLKKVEESELKKKRKNQAKNLLSHPKVQMLKKTFPHSTVDNIKVRD